MAELAFSAARSRALVSGLSALQTEWNCIYEVFPNGERVLIKKSEPPIYVERGLRFRIV